ncbi:MAG: hypothetical protein QM766_04985 [Burkholderiaceae bacterium]
MRSFATAVRSDRPVRRAGLASRALPAGLAIAIALSACQHVPSGESSPSSEVSAPSQTPSQAPERSDDGAVPSVVALMRSRAQPAPAWMVGSFVGTSLRSGLRNIEIDVTADGGIRGRVGDLQAQGQYIGSSRILWAHGNESIVERRGSGFRITQVKDPANVIEYQRR